MVFIHRAWRNGRASTSVTVVFPETSRSVVVAVDDGSFDGLRAIGSARALAARRHAPTEVVVLQRGWLVEAVPDGHTVMPSMWDGLGRTASQAVIDAIATHRAVKRLLDSGAVLAVCLPAGQRHVARLARRRSNPPLVVAL